MSKEVSGESKRVFVDRTKFIQTWETSDSAKEVADKLGIKASSALARASKYRTDEGIPLKNMTRGGGAKLVLEDALAVLAEIRGESVESLHAAGQANVAASAARRAEKASA